LWDLVTGTEKRQYQGGQGEERTLALPLAWSTDGKSFLSAGPDETLKLWETETGKILFSMGPVGATHKVAMSPDGKWAMCNNYTGIAVWDLTTGKPARELMGNMKAITALAFSPTGQLALAATKDGTILLWDLPQWKQAGKLVWP